MRSTVTIRPAVPGDLSVIADFLSQLGYPVRRQELAALLGPILEDRRHAVLVAEELEHGVVGMLSLSSRPALRLQGWVGTIEELVVGRGLRNRGIGERLVQYAKGMATERGWVRLEALVSRRRESNRRGFLFTQGFVTGECSAYRWGVLEGHHQAPPVLDQETRPVERI